MPRTRKVVLRRLTDQEQRRLVAAKLVGCRIMQGITAVELLAHLGYDYQDVPVFRRMVLSREDWAAAKLYTIEQGLAEDGRLSTLQRYARAVGVRGTPQLFRLRRPPIRTRLYMMGARRKPTKRTRTKRPAFL